MNGWPPMGIPPTPARLFLRENTMPATTLKDLFVHALSDIANAERQLTKALPKLARAATDPTLAAAFKSHLAETRVQIERIDQVVELAGVRLKRLKCAAMEGLVEEGDEVMAEIAKGPVLDAALIGAAQKVEHYEIASYGTLIAFARHLGMENAIPLLQETLDEEKATDRKLTALAEEEENARAEAAGQ
jgi:ferritin-like metal-binding protein YciE